MDLSPILQTRTKKFWWMDVLFYFAISLLVSALLCYAIFSIKNGMQRKDIQQETAALQTVGTDQQKADEQDVLNYKGKIGDFTNLLENHEFASNVFAFMQSETMPNVWYKQFSLDEKGSSIQLSGEADSMDALSRQVAVFEKNKYVKSIGTLSSALGQSARISFNISLTLSQNIFGYIADTNSIAGNSTASLSQQSPPNQTTAGGQAVPLNTAANAIATGAQGTATPQPQSGLLSVANSIVSFAVLSNPSVQGVLNETNHTITLQVPYGTNITKLQVAIAISQGATVSPASGTYQDFSSPVKYTVTAADGSAQDYTATVVVLPAPVAKKTASSQTNLLNMILLVSGASIVVIIIIILIFILKGSKPKNKPVT